jgi:hypothetical protein
MRAKAKKVLADTKFSAVDTDLNELHKFIVENSDYLIFDSGTDTRTTPFVDIHGDIKSKGKQL